jgi:ATP-dependent Clp protease adaptor protein ClpS
LWKLNNQWGRNPPVGEIKMTTEIQIEEKIVTSLQPPKMWKVIVLNDEKTPMEFVIELLTDIFKHSVSAAKDITLEIHNSGSAVAGIYTHEIAETKGIESTQLARSNGFPLRITLEQEE